MSFTLFLQAVAICVVVFFITVLVPTFLVGKLLGYSIWGFIGTLLVVLIVIAFLDHLRDKREMRRLDRRPPAP